MNDKDPYDTTPYDPFAAPREPEPTEGPKNLEEAYLHLYQVEPHPWEDRAMYEARKIARDDFEKKLEEAGLTIQSLVSMGQIRESVVQRVAGSSLINKLIKRI